MNIDENKRKYILIGLAVLILIAVLLFLIEDFGGSDDATSSETVAENSLVVVDSTEEYTFRNNYRLEEHYEKHGKEMGFKDAEEYEDAASDVVNNPEALHKTEKEDGDDVYYVKNSNEFVIVSSDGYIRTYFNPDDGIDYYNRQ